MGTTITLIWISFLGAVIAMLGFPASREVFVELTKAHPYVMGFVKISVLGTMGELLGARIARGKWILSGIRIYERVLVWGILGLAFTLVFPLFSFGAHGLLETGLLPGESAGFWAAFWSSFLMNTLFAFEMMVFHRFTDTIIEHGGLFRKWDAADIFMRIDWRNMFRVVLPTCLWFWVPAHTFTFFLPPEFRVMSAALLAIALGIILGFSKRMKAKVK